MLCLCGFELYPRWVPLLEFIRFPILAPYYQYWKEGKHKHKDLKVQ